MTALDKAAKIAHTVSVLAPQLQQVALLVGLGVTTYQRVREFYRSQGHDDETLDAIIAECDRRIARWGTLDVPGAPPATKSDG